MTNTAIRLSCNKTVAGSCDPGVNINLTIHNNRNLLHYRHNSQDVQRRLESIFMNVSTALALHNLLSNTTWTEVTEKHTVVSPTIKNQREASSSAPIEHDWGDSLCSVGHKQNQTGTVALQPFGKNFKSFKVALRASRWYLERFMETLLSRVEHKQLPLYVDDYALHR